MSTWIKLEHLHAAVNVVKLSPSMQRSSPLARVALFLVKEPRVSKDGKKLVF